MVLNILHINDFAGVASSLAEAQRKEGHNAEVLDMVGLGPIKWNWVLYKNRFRFDMADIIHLHGGIRKSQLGLRFFRDKIIVHFHGTEARSGGGLYHLQWANKFLCSTPDLKKYLPPETEYIPNPVGIEKRTCENTENGPVIVGHFPINSTQAKKKGTDLIERAIAPMETANLLIVQGVPHHEALAAMRKCDIVIDQINSIGAYGMVTLEALAMGKPVICTLNPFLYPEVPPIIALQPNWLTEHPNNLTEESIRSSLRDLIETRDKWPELGKQGWLYLDSFHNPNTISRRILSIYNKVIT